MLTVGSHTQSAAPGTEEKRPQLFVGNRWIHTIYTGYGVIKQRILLRVIREAQANIDRIMNGKRVELPRNQDIVVDLDMSQISHYNNYHQVRKAVHSLSTQSIQLYNDPTFKKAHYTEAPPLIAGYERTGDRKIIRLIIRRSVAEQLQFVDFGYTKKSPHKKVAYQYTKFDPFTICNKDFGFCKYRMPLYMLICSYAERGGFTIDVDELRMRLQVEEKYKGFDNFHRFILQHVQKELQIFGAFSFNFTLVKTGRTVKQIVFKIFANKKYDPNHVWVRLQRALNVELPYFVRFTEEQREQFNYLLAGNYDLDQVYNKFEYIHKRLVAHHAQGTPRKDPFSYTLISIHEKFPPPV